MLNVFFRRAARLAHAPHFWLAASWACAWMVWAPTVHAAKTEPPEQAASAPFKQYQGWRDEALQDWREANDRVGEIGGWRTYLRESQIEGDGAEQGHPGHSGH